LIRKKKGLEDVYFVLSIFPFFGPLGTFSAFPLFLELHFDDSTSFSGC